MRIHNLEIKNIGPFRHEIVNFISQEDSEDTPPVIIITGENGTGKSIILDAIRTLFAGLFGKIERDINSSLYFSIRAEISLNGNKLTNIKTQNKSKDGHFVNDDIDISKLFVSSLESKYAKDFVFDYWTSKLSQDKFNISNIQNIEHEKYLDDVLYGIHKNIDVTKIITYLDYLKGSKDSSESEIGQRLYSILEEIINIAINHGELSHISRINLTPIIKIRDREISLDKLSSGNLYLIQRLINLVKQVYSICLINQIPIKDYKEIKGVLLIDEAENHLHPKWQKIFLTNILKLFPKLQIIVTTHSPFIVSSIENSRVYVCKDNIDHSTISEETDFYINSPIEEILSSPLFSTSNFNVEITELLKERKTAITSKDKIKEEEIEEKLLKLNPDYFNYLNLNSIIDQLKNEKHK